MPEFSSREYWEQRYAEGGNSGSGSYGRLAVYKANVINVLVHELDVRQIIEFGSGDGHQAGLFAIRRYVGVDVSPTAVQWCRELYADRPDWTFLTLDDYREVPFSRPLALSLDVLFHLVEDAVFDDYMNLLFDAGERYVLIYASNHDELEAEHVRHRRFTDWVAKNRPEWRLTREWEQPFAMTEDSNPRHTTKAAFHLFEPDT